MGSKKLLFGAAKLGIGRFNTATSPRIYGIWIGMLRRCLEPSDQTRFSAYKNATIDPKWLNFQRFAKDITKMDNHDNPNFELDKDLRLLGNKKYGPEFCSFVPKSINRLLNQRSKKRGNLPLGVVHEKYKDQVYIRSRLSIRGKHVYLGRFDTDEEAHHAYLKARRKYIRDMAKEYKAVLHADVYTTLRNFDFEQVR